MGDRDTEVLKQTVARLERKVNELGAGSDIVTNLGARSPVDFQPVPIDPPTPPAANQIANGDLSHSTNTWFETVAAPATDKVRECARWFSNDVPVAGQTLTTTNAISSSTNKTLKAPTHSTYSAAYCDWGLPDGIARLTGLKSLDAPFPNNAVFPNRPMYLGAIVALKDSTIRVPSDFRVSAMLYNNDPGELDFFKSGQAFTVTGATRGTPAGTTERRYKILAETDRGYEFLSAELTVANAPDDNSFTVGVDVRLSWDRIDGILKYKVYRHNITAGTYDLLKEITSGSNTYGDNNYILETGVGSYPSASDDRVKCFVSTLTGALDNLAVNGVSLKWSSLFLNIPVPSTLDHVGSGFQWLRIAMSKSLDREVSDAVVVEALDVLSSDAADFVSLDAGRAIVVTDADGNIHSTTIATYDNPDEITMTDPWPYSSANGCTLYIVEGGDHGLLMDMIHIGYISRSAYAPFPDDLNRTLPSTAAPNSSSQGGLGPGGDNGDPGGGGLGCIEVSTPVWILFGNEFAALPFLEVPIGQLLKSGNHQPNQVMDTHPDLVSENLHIVRCANGVELPCSEKQVLFRSVTDSGIPVYRLLVGDSVLTCHLGRDECSPIISRTATGRQARVGTFTLSPGNRFLAGYLRLRWWQRLLRFLKQITGRQTKDNLPSGIYCHNVKRDNLE